MAATTPVVATETYSPVTGIQKAGKNSLIQLLIWGLSMLIAYPDIILRFLGNYQTMTLGAAVIVALNFVKNWLDNKNLGNA